MLMTWVLSDAPADWISVLGLVVSLGMLVTTTCYVVFTFRLMTSATNTARLALQQTQRERLAQWLPIQIAVRGAIDAVTEWLAKHRDQQVPEFIELATNRTEANLPHLLGQVLPTALRLSGTLYSELSDAANKLQELAQTIEGIWPYSTATHVDAEYRLHFANSRAQYVLDRLASARTIVDPIVQELRRSLPNA
jgi:hypothetical protein